MEIEERTYRRKRGLFKHALKVVDVKPGGIHFNDIIKQQE